MTFTTKEEQETINHLRHVGEKPKNIAKLIGKSQSYVYSRLPSNKQTKKQRAKEILKMKEMLKDGFSVTDIAKKIGKSTTYIGNRIPITSKKMSKRQKEKELQLINKSILERKTLSEIAVMIGKSSTYVSTTATVKKGLIKYGYKKY